MQLFQAPTGESQESGGIMIRNYLTRHVYLVAIVAGLIVGLAVSLQPINAAMVFVGAIVLAMSMRYPGFILSALLGLMLFQRFQMIGFGLFNVPLSLAKLSALVAIVVCVSQAMLRRQRLVVLDQISLGLIAVVLAYLLSTLSADDPTIARRRMMSMLLLSTLTYFSYRFVTRKQFEFVLNVIPYLLIVMCAMSFWDLYHGGVWSRATEITRRAEVVRGGGSFGDPNVWSSVNLFFIPLMLHHVRQTKYFWQKCIDVAVILGLVLNIGMSFSRAGYLVLGLLLLLIAWQSRRNPLLLVGGLAVLLGIFALTVPLDVVEHRFSRLVAVSAAGDISSASISSRYKVLTGGVEVFLSNPIFGVGPDHYGQYVSYGTIADYGKASHNIYMQIAVELGLIGLLAFGSFGWAVYRCYIYLRENLQDEYARSLVQAMALSFFAYAAMGATLNILYHSYMWFILGLVLSMTRWIEVEGTPVNKDINPLLRAPVKSSRLLISP